MTVNGKSYTIIKLLGKGKGGYSYLAESGNNRYVLKQIHHEPCDYYQFGNKLEAEIRDYKKLKEIGIKMPAMLEADVKNERILKEFIEGDTIYQLVLEDKMKTDYIEQLRRMCALLYAANTNIDYFPTNFVVHNEERPYINFDLAAKRFYGSNGCNIVNGDMTLSGKTGLKLDNIIATMKMCSDAPFEYLINLALSEVSSYSARQVGPNTFLDLKGNGGSVIMVLRRHNMDFLNGAWAITSLNGTPMPAEGAEDAATMTINIPDLQIHGTTGCNIFNGQLFIDPDKNNSMQFVNIGTTRMACPPNSRETEFLLGLEMVETAKATGTDTIAMYSADGKLIFEMRRINYPREEQQVE